MSIETQLASLQQLEVSYSHLLTETESQEVSSLLDQASIRRSLSPNHTVIGLFGATGSGKSSLFNALVGTPVAKTGLIRPTTSSALAALWGEGEAEPLLKWLNVDQTFLVQSDGKPQVILLDLPDFDSISESNREIVDRLTKQVDVLVWVVDPQKYADRVIHDDYLRPLQHHASVTLVALNQIDLVSAHERESLVRSAKTLLNDDGLGSLPLYVTSAKTGEGVSDLSEALFGFASEKTARDQRLLADISTWATTVDLGDEPSLSQKDLRKANQGFALDVAGLRQIQFVSDAVGTTYRKRAGEATGWFFTSWMHRFRTDPLKRLHLRGSSGQQANPPVTSLPQVSGNDAAALSTAIRTYATKVSVGLPDIWRTQLFDLVESEKRSLPNRFDEIVATTNFKVAKSWWWTLASLLQWFALALASVSALWYLLSWFTAAFGLPLVPILKFEGLPVPGLGLVFSLVFGLTCGAAFGLLNKLVAKRRRKKAQRTLENAFILIAHENVCVPSMAFLEQAKVFRTSIENLRR